GGGGVRGGRPLRAVARPAPGAAELGGVPTPAGAVVSVALGAANRDPARYPDPDRFDVFREPRPHVAFAYGAHTCLGMHLARMETRVVLEAVLDRLRGIRLDPQVADVHITGLGFRAPRRLPVVFAA